MNWYEASDTPELVEFGPVRVLSITGQGAPEGPEYGLSVQALYTVAGPLLRGAMPALEGRWWVEDDGPPLEVPREKWHWHLFLRIPDSIDPAQVDQARETARPQAPAVSRVQLVTFTEGRSVQMLHHGSYDEEPKSLAQMEEFMQREGLVPNGLHHEIYLSLHERTILRQPVRAA